MKSKRSILAKHLYFDRTIAAGYDLRTEEGRASFLEERCRIRFEGASSRKAARQREMVLESSKKYRYVGRLWRDEASAR